MPRAPKPLIAPPLIERGVLVAARASPLVLLMATSESTRPKLEEPTVAVAPLLMARVAGNLIVVPLKAPLPRAPVVGSWVKTSPPQSPASGVQLLPASTLGHSSRPTLLSRRLVRVAPPAVASSVAPLK